MQTGIDNIIKHRVIEISVMGVLIVFMALAFISLFLMALPKVVGWLEPYLPDFSEGHHQATPHGLSGQSHDPQEAIVAAIGFALHHQNEK